MKKIYSFMLMATMLLIGINANAAFADAKALQDALNGASDGETIYLNGNLQMSSTIFLDLEDKSVTLDLTGNTISFNGSGKAVDMFHLYRGKLTVKNGVITHAGSTSGTPLIFKVFGTREKVAAGNYTHLTINEDVQLFVSGGGSDKKGYGISINERDSIDSTKHPEYPTSLPSTKVNGVALANGIRLDVHGYVEMMSDKGYCVKVNGTIKYAPAHWDKLGVTNPTANDTATWVACAPHVYLHSTAHLVANASSTGVGAIYAAGYGVWDIRCVAEGSCALAAKSGEINVVDAVLKSTATEYHIPAGLTAGVETQGTAVLIESNSSYPGYTQVNFSGDTRVEAVSGYAIEEAITTASQTKVSAIDIEGGAFIGGNEAGCIYIDDRTLSAEGTQVTIGGGSYEDRTPAQQAATDALITQIITGSNTYTTQVATGNTATTGSAIVITSGTTPGVQLPSLDVDGLYGISHLNPDSSVNLSQVTDGTVFTLDDATGHGDLTLGDVVMNGNNLTIIVNNGITFTAKQLIMNDKARIIVKAGGKLIVYGEQGMYTSTYENLVIEAQEGKSATFLIHPAVTSNKHPQATVEFVSKAFRVSSTNLLWQRFGVPSYNALHSIECLDPSLTTFVGIYDHTIGEQGDWRNLGKVGELDMEEMNQPFVCYEMLSNSQAGGTRYKMEAELVGNGNAEINTNIEWPTCANSYLADIDLEKFYEALGDNMTKAIYVYTMQGNTNYYTWEPYDKMIAMIYPERGILPSMQGFILHRRTDEKTPAILSYEEAVYNHALGINAAPARRANNNDMTLAQIRMTGNEASDNIIVAQSDAFSAEFDNGYEAEKHMGSDLNLYVTDEAKMAHFATDELNNTYVGYSCAKAGVYTLSFENVRGQELTLVDLTNGVRTAMTNGATYTFTAAANETNDYRFQIVEAAKMPTDVEAIEAVAKKVGIYTLTGQYLGNASKWNTLPAGIYVVDGVKKVK